MTSEPLQDCQSVKGKPLAAVFIVVLAIALRLLLLGIKPPHFDEGINGWFVDQMTQQGFYRYDPTNYHGPLHFYLLFVMQTLFGRHIEVLRLVAVLSSVGSVVVLLKCDRFFGRRIALWAALAMAVSPAMTFYGRYAIHEASLLFFMVWTLWGLLGLWRFGSATYLRATVLGATGMVLTKETYLIHMASLLLAFPTLWMLERFSPSASLPKAAQSWSWGDLLKVSALSAGLLVFFYSGNFLDPNSLKGLYQTFAAWIQTGTAGHGHEKPFYYWLKLMGRYEWPAALGLLLTAACLLPRQQRLLRFTAIYGAGVLTAYSIVAYKTPWCIISLIWPFYFLFGAFIDWLWSRCKAAAIAVAMLLLGVSLASAVRLNFIRYTDPTEPYVYVQTFKDIHTVTEPLLEIARRNPAAYHLQGRFYMSSFYPLPWVLGEFTNIGYYTLDNPPPPPDDADFLLIEDSKVSEIEPRLQESYFTQIIKLRDAQAPAKLYLNARVFWELFPNRVPDIQR